MIDTELEAADKTTPRFTLEGLKTRAKCVDVYDGDTAQLAFRANTGAPIRRFSCRLAGYNCAEIKTKSPSEHASAVVARDALRGLILNRIIDIDVGKFDKYGRPLVRARVLTGAGVVDVCDWMIQHGHAAPYSGSGAKVYKVSAVSSVDPSTPTKQDAAAASDEPNYELH
jgi:endonuclease YncB( thermonuclease family)